MILTSRMIRLFAVVLQRSMEDVTEELLRQGVMQFVKMSEVAPAEPNAVVDVSPGPSLAGLADAKKRIEGFLGAAGLTPAMPEEIDLKNLRKLDLDEERKRIDTVVNELQRIKERQRTVRRELQEIDDIRQQVSLYGGGLSKEALSSKYSFISLRFGDVPSSNHMLLERRLKEVPSVLLTIGEGSSGMGLLLVSMKRDHEKIDTILREVGWKEVEPPQLDKGIKEDVAHDLDKRREQLQKTGGDLERETKELIGKNKDILNDIWMRIRLTELHATIQSYFKKTAHTVIFSGWIPLDKRVSVEKGILKATGGKCYLEWHHPALGEKGSELQHIPVQFRNPRFLAPFQMLVKNFGVPEYGTIDPTPFIMVTYLSMFALMFADVGQGAVLLLLGILAAIGFRKKKENLVNLARLISFCGAASIIGGVLFGSYFGMGLLKPVWFDFHGIISGEPYGDSHIRDLFNILAIAIYFGISVIAAGLLFNWINMLRQRHWMKLFLDKGGIIGGWFYGGGVYVASYMVKHDYRQFPGMLLLFLLVGLPALLMFTIGPLKFFHGSKKQFTLLTPLNFLMEWIVELLELFSGYLSNTLSFMRVAGLGIAHVSLMIAFFEIARMANGGGQGPPYNIWYFLILLVGNVLVIGLEGLSAGVQALRLNYYEFFSKFLRGSGEAYSPISLRSR
jgi:V/A-type H+-transporting ATPase subunit I